MLNRIYAGLSAIFSRTARRDNLLDSIQRDLSRDRLGDATRKTRLLVRRFAGDPAIAEPVALLIGRLRADGRADEALDVALQSHRLAAQNNPLHEKARLLCHAIADETEDAVRRVGVWGDIVRAAPADTQLRDDALARWQALAGALPAPEQRANACLDLAEITFYDAPSAFTGALRDTALSLALPFVAATADPSVRADFYRRGVLAADEFSNTEILWVQAWERTIAALPRDQAWEACTAAAGGQQKSGRGDSLLLRDAALYRMEKLAADMPPREKTEAFLSIVSYRRELDGPGGERDAVDAWRKSLADLPERAEDKARLCYRAAFESPQGSLLEQAALAEWRRQTDLVENVEDRWKICVESAHYAASWEQEKNRSALAAVFLEKARGLMPRAAQYKEQLPPLTPDFSLSNFRAWRRPF